MLEDFDLNNIQDLRQARECIMRLLNLIENLQADNRELRAQVQRLRDENNWLKGEQGQPTIKPNQRRSTSTSHSSERERRKPRTWRKRRKTDQIRIDHVQALVVEPARLPADAEFKGYEEVVVQDIAIQTHNTLFRKALVST